MKIAFCSDLHLNFIPKNEIINFANKITDTGCDILLISGDIAESQSLDECLSLLANTFCKPIYYVLGNHCYYKSSIKDTINYCNKYLNTGYLNFMDNRIVKINNEITLIGQNIFYDLSVGNLTGDFDIADFDQIKDFKPLMYPKQRLDYFQNKAREDAINLHNLIEEAVNYSKKIIYLAHPPLDEDISFYGDRKSPSYSIGYFCNKIVGDKLKEMASKYLNIDFLALTGHSHYRASYEVDNLKMYVAAAKYYEPNIEKIFSFIK